MSGALTDVALRTCWANLLDGLQAFAEKAAPVFAANDWTWFQSDGPHPPDAQAIHGTLYSLAWEAAKQAETDGHSSVSSGRLLVTFNKYASGWQGTAYLAPQWTHASERG